MSTILWSRRVAPTAAVAVGVLTLGLAVASAPLDYLARRAGAVPGDVIGIGTVGAGVAVGALVAARRPRNPIGWILLAIFFLADVPDGQYAVLDYRMHHGTLPLGPVAVALVADTPLFLVLIAILLWLFPDGRLPAGRWRPAFTVFIAGGVLLGLAGWVGGAVAVAGHRMPVDASGSLTANPAGVWAVIQHVAFVAVLASWLAWLAVQVPRYRRSASVHREQLKWVYSGAIIFVLAIFIPAHPGNSVGSQVAYAADVLGLAVLPVCIGVAVLKYRLYEIDRIISRVIAYAIITAVLAGVFAGLVVLVTHVLPFKSPVAVAAATLAVAALFNPLRTRVQHAVDRRFNRARYNAEVVVAAFTARLRQSVDLDAVRGDLVNAVHSAFEPAHVSVWLTPVDQHRPAPPGAPSPHRST